MKFENTEVWGFRHAFRGMRNPKESWMKSDSDLSDSCHRPKDICSGCPYFNPFGSGCLPQIGEKDMTLAQSLIRAGSEHRKFMRQIFVSVDITAPLYWWKEFDTYKVGTTANSTSTMHKLSTTPITIDCFETDDYDGSLSLVDSAKIDSRVSSLIDNLEQLRQMHLHYDEQSKRQDIPADERFGFKIDTKKYWKELIRWLPESWLQTRTVTMTYENLLGIYRQRNSHKLSEWRDSFCDWIKTLPYSNELIQCK